MKTNGTTRRIRYDREVERLWKNDAQKREANAIHTRPTMDELETLGDSIHHQAIDLSGYNPNTNFAMGCLTSAIGGLAGFIGGAVLYRNNHSYLPIIGAGLVGSILGASVPALAYGAISAVQSGIDHYKIKKHNQKKEDRKTRQKLKQMIDKMPLRQMMDEIKGETKAQ